MVKTDTHPSPVSRQFSTMLLILVGFAAFVAVFILADNAYFRFADSWFPKVGASVWLATLWGVVSRAHLLILLIPLAVWRPRFFGFQIGQIWQHRRLLLGLLVANCGIIVAYLWLTGSGTPYSGNQWLATEIL